MMEGRGFWDLALPVVFLALAAMIFSSVKDYAASRRWPLEDGVVTNTSRSCTRSRGTVNCTVYVDYSCGGIGGRAAIDDNSLMPTGQDEAAEVEARYPVGSSVKVRLKPGSGRSWLEGAKPRDWKIGVMFLGMAFFTFSVRGGRGRG